jgi:hypothetical protein
VLEKRTSRPAISTAAAYTCSIERTCCQAASATRQKSVHRARLVLMRTGRRRARSIQPAAARPTIMRGRYSALSRPAIWAALALSVVAAKMGRASSPISEPKSEISSPVRIRRKSALRQKAIDALDMTTPEEP